MRTALLVAFAVVSGGHRSPSPHEAIAKLPPKLDRSSTRAIAEPLLKTFPRCLTCLRVVGARPMPALSGPLPRGRGSVAKSRAWRCFAEPRPQGSGAGAAADAPSSRWNFGFDSQAPGEL